MPLPLFLIVPHTDVSIEKWPSTALADNADASPKKNVGILSQSLNLTPGSPFLKEVGGLFFVVVVVLQSLGVPTCLWWGEPSQPK